MSRTQVEVKVSFWNLYLCVVIGWLTLLLLPVFRIEGVAFFSIALAGLITLVSSALAMSRNWHHLRLVNLFAATLLISWFVGHPEGPARWFSFGFGCALAALCVRNGLHYEERDLHQSRP